MKGLLFILLTAIVPELLPPAINTPAGEEYGPTLTIDDNTIYFVGLNRWESNMTEDIFVSHRDKRTGEVVAQGFQADKLTVCNRTYKGFTVGVSTFKGLDECGFFGLKFFQRPAVFDFDENKLYLE